MKKLTVKQIRDALGLTQTEAAKLLQSSLRTYQAWESGETRIHPIIERWFRDQVVSGT